MTNQLHILNADESLTKLVSIVKRAFNDADKIAKSSLSVSGVDCIVRNLPLYAIPELGIGGFTDENGKLIYLSLDPSHEITYENLYSQFLHEFHHAARFQKHGFNKNLGDALVSEGLATLFEEEITNNKPIYAELLGKENNSTKTIKSELSLQEYDHSKWFFGTDKNIPKWFGYYYGYELCKKYSKETRNTAASLAATDSKELFA